LRAWLGITRPRTSQRGAVQQRFAQVAQEHAPALVQEAIRNVTAGQG
jgi:hypothetical protein